MTTQLHNKGEEFERKVLSGEISLPSSVTLILFHDGEVSGDLVNGDNLSAASDIGDISTQPNGNYASKTVNLDGSASWTLGQDGNSDYRMEITATLTYDLSVSTNPSTIDAYGVVVNWDDGTGAADHLWWTDVLNTDFDVQSVDNLGFDNGSIAVSGQNAP